MNDTTQSGPPAGFTLARWFQTERFANRPEDDFVREEVLGELSQAEAVAKHGDELAVKTPHGVCLIEPKEVQGSKLVVFDYVEDARWTRTNFWMNASSVDGLLAELRSVRSCGFDDLFLYGRVQPA